MMDQLLDTDSTQNDRAVLDALRKAIWRLKHGYPDVSVYIKGLCQPNPGLGAYGVVLQFPSRQEVTSGFLPETTNYQAELCAAIAALRLLTTPHEVDLYSNSQSFVKAVVGTYNRNRYPERWSELDQLTEPHVITWYWVRSDPLIEQARVQADNQIAVNSTSFAILDEIEV